VVLAFKYGGVPGLARPLAEALVRATGSIDGGKGAALVPVPLHPRRLRERGQNALLALAGEVAAAHERAGGGAPRVADCLERPWLDVPQAGLRRAERQRNAAESFAMARPELVFGLRAILLDDVLTTGATAFACSRLLLDGGAREVRIIALARASLNPRAPSGRPRPAVAGSDSGWYS
jgi:predicted amidophosphoribosyltransferase